MHDLDKQKKFTTNGYNVRKGIRKFNEKIIEKSTFIYFDLIEMNEKFNKLKKFFKKMVM